MTTVMPRRPWPMCLDPGNFRTIEFSDDPKGGPGAGWLGTEPGAFSAEILGSVTVLLLGVIPITHGDLLVDH